MAEPDNKQSFWMTLPGFLTGMAALLTALTGLLVVAFPHGFSASKQSTAATVGSTAGTADAAPVAASSPASTPSATSQQQKATVLVTAKDGTATRLFLKNFKHSYEEAIELTSGQSISFDKIKSIDFSTVHDYQEDVKVTLTDGKTLDGSLKTGYSFEGDSEIGPFTIRVENLKQISFQR